MRFPALILSLLLALFLATGPALAVQPDEVLADPVLEARARELSKVLRCPVCQAENIDESNAELSRDLRLLVRERLVAGDSDEAALAFIVDRYGEYVLFRPDASGSNLLLWLAGPAMLVLGGGFAFGYLRRRRPETAPAPADLTEAERKRLAEILQD
jgi:cytochrome c-type biogenesis protein CcmH